MSMITCRFTKRLQLLLLPHGDLSTHFRVFNKSFSSGIQKSSESEKKGKQIQFTVSYLIGELGFSLETAKLLSTRVCIKSPAKPDSVIVFLRNYGLDNTQISKLVRTNPSLLLTKIEKTLEPKLKFFQSVGISGADLVDVLVSSGNILRYSLANRIVPTYNFVNNLLQEDRKKVVEVLKNVSFFHICPSWIASNILELQRIGVPNSSVKWILMYRPEVLSKIPCKFSKFVKQIVEMGFDPSQKKFILALKAVSEMTNKAWENKMDVFRRFGWSKSEINLVFRSSPTVMGLSEKNIARKLDFLVNKMGWTIKTVSRTSAVLSLSMEKRIIPRCSVIEEFLLKGVIEEKPGLSIFCMSDVKFLEKFMIETKRKMPQRKIGLFIRNTVHCRNVGENRPFHKKQVLRLKKSCSI